MDKHIELEYKTMLSESQFKNFKKKYPFNEPILQINHYYDNANHDLHKKRFNLRIREVNDELLLTLKTPNDIGVMEYECLVDTLDITKCKLPTDLLEVLSFINIADLETIGSLTTNRSILDNELAVVCLDESIYAGMHDYEIEYEVKKEHRSLETFKALLRVNGIKEFKPAMGKAKRLKKAINF